jgi:hypothetical protein
MSPKRPKRADPRTADEIPLQFAVDPEAKPGDGVASMARLLVAIAEREKKTREDAAEGNGG